MGKLDGRVAIVTGGARGQGRSHALTLAREGASIVIADVAAQIDTIPYQLGTETDLKETQQLVEDLDARCITVKADVRSSRDIQQVADAAIEEFGQIDILCANAGVFSHGFLEEMSDDTWDTVIATDLTGIFKSIRAVLPHMHRRGYGRIIATSSMAGRAGFPTMAHYTAAKWGAIGLIKAAALEVGAAGITVNGVAPSTVETPMVTNSWAAKVLRPDLEDPTVQDMKDFFQSQHAIKIPWVQPQDISNAVLFLASDDARYITGEIIHVAAGLNAHNAA